MANRPKKSSLWLIGIGGILCLVCVVAIVLSRRDRPRTSPGDQESNRPSTNQATDASDRIAADKAKRNTTVDTEPKSPEPNDAGTSTSATHDPERLDGVWNTVSSEYRGAPDKLYAGVEFQFLGNQMVMTNFLQRYTMNFTVDSGSTPNRIDISSGDANENEKTIKWIYELTGDTLKLCWNGNHATVRPEAFKTDENSDSVLLVLERVGKVSRLPRGEDSWAHYQGGGMYATGSPSMSPDGSTIVFSSPRTGNGDIYKVDRDGGNRTRLTELADFEADPIFSPDGSTVAFVRESDGCRHIWLMDKDGKNQRQLTLGDVIDELNSFSPDGSEIFFLRSPLATGGGRSATPFAVSVLSGETSIRTLEGLPNFSPDGKKVTYVLFDESRGQFEIWLMDADGSNKRFLTEGHAPGYSPDGKSILFCQKSGSPGSEWAMMDPDGTNRRELCQLHGPVFSSDGKHIVCFSPEYRRQILRMDLDGSNKTILDAPTGYAGSLRPCQGGFVFSLVVSDSSDRVGDIFFVDTNDWTVERITSMR